MPEQLLRLNREPRGDWRDPKVEFHKGVFCYSALPKNLNYLGFQPYPRHRRGYAICIPAGSWLYSTLEYSFRFFKVVFPAVPARLTVVGKIRFHWAPGIKF